MGLKSEFADAFLHNRFGTVTGSLTGVQFPDSSGTECNILRFKADPNNIGVFYIGNNEGQPFPMSAGDDTGWVSASNLNQFWHMAGSGTADYLYYWYQV